MTHYQVQKGDTLYKIAKQHGTTIQALAEKNNIENVNCIFAGSTLKINDIGISVEKTNTLETSPITLPELEKVASKKTGNKAQRIKELKDMEKEIVEQYEKAYKKGDYKLASIYRSQQMDVRQQLIALGDEMSCFLDKVTDETIKALNQDRVGQRTTSEANFGPFGQVTKKLSE